MTSCCFTFKAGTWFVGSLFLIARSRIIRLNLYFYFRSLQVAFDKIGSMTTNTISKQRKKQEPAVMAELDQRLRRLNSLKVDDKQHQRLPYQVNQNRKCVASSRCPLPSKEKKKELEFVPFRVCSSLGTTKQKVSASFEDFVGESVNCILLLPYNQLMKTTKTRAFLH